MKNPLTRTLIPTASLLAFASVVAAQNTQSLQQLEGKVSTLPQASGSSLSGFLNSARYEFGRGLTFSSPDGDNSMTIGGQVQVGYGYTDRDGGGSTFWCLLPAATGPVNGAADGTANGAANGTAAAVIEDEDPDGIPQLV